MDRLVFLATPVGLLHFLLVGDCYQRVIVEPGDPFDIAVSLAWKSVSPAGSLDEFSGILIDTADPEPSRRLGDDREASIRVCT